MSKINETIIEHESLDILKLVEKIIKERIKENNGILIQQVDTYIKTYVDSILKNSENVYVKNAPNVKSASVKVTLQYYSDPKISSEPQRRFIATCLHCGSNIYESDVFNSLINTLTIDRPYCYHCGSKLDTQSIEKNILKYDNSL